MNTISVTTSQNIDVEYELASLGDRVLGRIIDNVVLFSYFIILLVFIGFSNFARFFGDNFWLIILLLLPYVFYDIVCETLLNGQSAGKRIMKIKVISLNGAQPSFSQYLIRWLFRFADFLLSSSLLAFIMVAASEKKQRLGDLVAGTALVKTHPRTQFHQTIYEPAAESTYQVSYPEVVNLHDSDIQLIKEILITVNRTGNTTLALQAGQKVEQTLHIMSKQPDPQQFLQVVIADYNHLTSLM